MNFRVRGPQGQTTLTGVEPDTPLHRLLDLLAERTGVPAGGMEVLAGFPPAPLAADGAATAAALGLRAGDALTVRARAGAPAAPAPAAAAAEAAAGVAPAGMSEDEQLARAIAASLGEAYEPPPPPAAAAAARPAAPPPAAAPAPRAAAGVATLGSSAAGAAFAPLPGGGGGVVRRAVADDNSCLFSAVGYAAEGSRAAAPRLRRVVADAVLADPGRWSEAVLGKPPSEYAKWIADPRRWGGAVELAILSERLGVEIAAFDVQTTRVDVYGEGAGHAHRVMLVYDGLHYDALALAAAPGAGEAADVARLPRARVDAAMAGAAALVARAHAERRFTNTATFTLRCGACGAGLTGEREALEHAAKTGHSNFSEY